MAVLSKQSGDTVHILLVEDDFSLQNGIFFKLSKENHEVICADTVVGAIDLLSEGNFHLAILDINLPDGSGLDICRYIRQHSPSTFVLFLTAQDTETDIVMGYDIGADDYLTKPFSIAVLVGKITALSRRTTERPTMIEISLDTSRQMAVVRGERKSLTRNEMRLLSVFMENPNQIITKDRLLQVLWDIDGDFVDENTLAVNIRRLREKVEVNPSKPKLIETVRGVGYRMRGDD